MEPFSTQYILKGTPMTIRSPQVLDAEQLIALVSRADEETVFLSREPGEFSLTVAQEEAYIRKEMAKENVYMAVAEVEGELVALATVQYDLRKRFRHVGGVGIAIAQSHWGMGIGRTMLEEGILWLRDQQVEKVELTVDAGNLRAISLYHRLGFRVEGTIRHARKLASGTYRDEYRMALDLTRED